MSARLLDGENVVENVRLSFSGEVSVFQGAITAQKAGEYVLEILAGAASSGNFGRVQVPVVVQ